MTAARSQFNSMGFKKMFKGICHLDADHTVQVIKDSKQEFFYLRYTSGMSFSIAAFLHFFLNFKLLSNNIELQSICFIDTVSIIIWVGERRGIKRFPSPRMMRAFSSVRVAWCCSPARPIISSELSLKH